MKTRHKNKSMIARYRLLSIVLSAVLVVSAAIVFVYLTNQYNQNKYSYGAGETAHFYSFDLRAKNVEVKAAKLKIDNFYKNTIMKSIDGEANVTSKQQEDCSVYDDIKRYDTATKDGFQAWLDAGEQLTACRLRNDRIRAANEAQNVVEFINQYSAKYNRINIQYEITSQDNRLNLADVKISIYSPIEDISAKRLDIPQEINDYIDEPPVRYGNIINKTDLIADQTKVGLAWADVKQDTDEVFIKIEYKGMVKTIKIPLLAE